MKVSILASVAFAALVTKVLADPLRMNLGLNIELDLEDVDFDIGQEAHTAKTETPHQTSNACEKPGFIPPIVHLSYEDHQASCYVN